jgi:cellulose synthase/poly-beta-1,6-N-acetylglucosamine synthase-like glycosyltransferase
MESLRLVAAFVFWISAAAVGYAYLLYPLLLWLLTSWREGPKPRETGAASDLPTVSVLIVAHNEEAIIRERIENLLILDYPRERLELVIASDGSIDRTDAIVREFAAEGVELRALAPRAGKASALDRVVPTLKGEIVVLSDANTMMERGAIGRLARWFADPAVGVVCGRLVLTDLVTGRNVDSMYWRYETFLKKCESKLGGLLGANGAIYAIRRRVFPGIHPSTIVDDFVIPLVARIRSGCRIVYDETAIAVEETPPELGMEFHRRTRIGAGDFQSLAHVWPVLNPAHGWISFTFVSHKLVRWLCPFFLVAMALTSVALIDEPLYRTLFLAQVALYLVAFGGQFLSHQSTAGKAVRLMTMFAAMNAALLVGFFRWVTTRQRGVWERTAR